ncbi:hypothetical protein [Mesorhizobium sp. Cs1299R1N3]|uniref:hypothetical protein n=1 Tax=Mesorhizobium sp. Cs1299R1N3 TaxID=3015173 RepID=UPI00301CB014
MPPSDRIEQALLGNVTAKCFGHDRIVVTPGYNKNQLQNCLAGAQSRASSAKDVPRRCAGNDRKSVASFQGHAVDPRGHGKKPARVFGGDIDAGL